MKPIRSKRGGNSMPPKAPQEAIGRLSLSQKTPLDRLIAWESADPSRCEAIKQRRWKAARIWGGWDSQRSRKRDEQVEKETETSDSEDEAWEMDVRKTDSMQWDRSETSMLGSPLRTELRFNWLFQSYEHSPVWDSAILASTMWGRSGKERRQTAWWDGN